MKNLNLLLIKYKKCAILKKKHMKKKKQCESSDSDNNSDSNDSETDTDEMDTQAYRKFISKLFPSKYMDEKVKSGEKVKKIMVLKVL
jgi:hypothetical protein